MMWAVIVMGVVVVYFLWTIAAELNAIHQTLHGTRWCARIRNREDAP